MKFKTNIKCGGCIAAVTPTLDQAVGAGNWEVDLSHPDRILSLPATDLPADKVTALLANAGYVATVVA